MEWATKKWREHRGNLGAFGARVLGETNWRKALELYARVLGWVRWPFRMFWLLCFFTGFATITVFSFTTYQTVRFLNSLPNLEHLKFAELKAIAQSKVDERLPKGKIASPWVPISEVSRDYLYSIVMSEDSTFFEHDGLNFGAMIDSFAENLKERKPAFGASTISQQVVKNLFLSSEKSYLRKLKEALVTYQLERRFSKNEILELYFNFAELGPDIYGVEAASRHYFHKAPAEVNAAEGAFIALMLPSPRRNYYSIFQNRNLSKAKRKRIERVLRDMLYEEFISEKQYRQYTQFHYWGGRGDALARTPAGTGAARTPKP